MAFASVQAEEVSGTITFKTSSSDSSTAADTGNFVTGQVIENGGFTLSCTATNNCYTGINGLKMSSSSKNGSFTLNLGDTYNVKKVVVRAIKYKNDVAKLSVNESTAETLSDALNDYTFNINADISQIKVDMTKRGYIENITIIYEVAGEGEATAPVTPSLADDADFVGAMKVEISCETENAEIYYTTDGTDPTNDSEVYSEPFEITETTIVKAIAFNEVGASCIAKATYTRVAANPVISFEGDASAVEGEVVVSIETQNDAVAYYTLNGTTPSASSTIYEKPITIKADATLKVIAIEAGEYESGVTTKDFVMAVTGSDNIEGESCTLSFADVALRTSFSTKQQIWEQNGITFTNNKGSGSNIADYTNPVRLYKNSEIIVEFTSLIAKIEFACNTAAYATDLKNSIPGSTVSGKIVTVQLDGSSNSFTIENLTGGQVRMDALTVTPVAEVSAFELNVTEAGWATLYLGYNVVIPEDVTCYVISGVSEESVQLEEVAGILPANTAAIVNAEKGEYAFEPTEDKNENNINSLMHGTTNNKYIEEDAYVLANGENGIGLYKAEMAGGVWLNNANKAYLPASKVPAGAALSTSLRFDFGGTTAIEEVETEAAETVIYDLTGRRVNKITKAGVYIVNGRKILVK